jgi:hypothetical protein
MTQQGEGAGEALPEGWTDCAELAADPAAVEPPTVVRSGIQCFDSAQPYGGVPEGSITLWMGEMKAGKSRLVLALCAGHAFHGAKVAFLMGEMSPKEHWRRLLVMALGLRADELREGSHAEAVANTRDWLKDAIGGRLRFKAVPMALQDITAAAQWAGAGGIVAVDSIQRVSQVTAGRQRSDEVEAAMEHIVGESKRTGAAFHVLSEIGKAPAGQQRDAHQWTKHSASPRQNCEVSYIVHPARDCRQRIEVLDHRDSPSQSFVLELSERNGMPMLPKWEGGAP